MYNLTNITGANNIFEQIKAVNDMSGFLFWVLILLIFSTSLYMNYRGKPAKIIFITVTFIVMFVNILSWMGGLVKESFLIVSIVLFFISVLVFSLTGDT